MSVGKLDLSVISNPKSNYLELSYTLNDERKKIDVSDVDMVNDGVTIPSGASDIQLTCVSAYSTENIETVVKVKRKPRI